MFSLNTKLLMFWVFLLAIPLALIFLTDPEGTTKTVRVTDNGTHVETITEIAKIEVDSSFSSKLNMYFSSGLVLTSIIPISLVLFGKEGETLLDKLGWTK